MRKVLTAVVAVICLGGPRLLAAEDPRTLPPDLYQAMESGQNLEKVFLDPAYDRGRGFKLGSVEYRADTKISAVPEALNKSMGMLTRRDSPFTLNVVITKVTTGYKLIRKRVRGRLTLEGGIVDAKGKVVAAFVTTEPAGKIGAEGDDFQFACDAIATAISKDLL